ncbi:hypothetical protein [Nostoc sp.]|uniref:hypothetical protein n=1 Tax=Nostoc sp. TaxID=1180 RepID=UPI002FF6DF74
MNETQTQLPTDTWICASWQEYEQAIANLLNEKAKSYYYKGHMRLEMAPVSFDHGKDHVVIIGILPQRTRPRYPSRYRNCQP